MTVIIAAVAALAAAMAVHRALLRSPALEWLAPGYPAWWHGLDWARQAAVTVSLPVAGAIAGLAFTVVPLTAAAVLTVLLLATLASRAVRAATRKGR